ncbi:type VII secretion system-associated protein [Actinoplanes sp. CA-054009]
MDELLIDPEWLEEEDGDPPAEAVVGWWPARDDGTLGPFRSNPEYRPLFENSPADPLDAVLRLALHGEAELEQLREMLRDCLVELGLNGDGRPLLVRSPDGDLCAVVTTSVVHRERTFSPEWREVALAELVTLLPDGVNLLVNPGGPAWARLSGEFVREAAA